MSARRLEQLSLPVRRVLALGLLVALALIFLFWMVLPTFQWAAAAMDDLADVRFALARATRAALTEATDLAAQAESVHRELSSQMVAGPRETDAAGAFQAHVSQVLAAQGLIVETTAARVLPGQGPFRKLSLDWRGTGTEAALVAAIAAVESSRLLMRVERIVAQRRQPLADDGPLVVDLRIVAYWPVAAEAPASAPRVVR